jgi:hypothetical protein
VIACQRIGTENGDVYFYYVVRRQEPFDGGFDVENERLRHPGPC